MPNLTDDIRARIQAIATDNRNGAVYLARQAAEVLSEVSSLDHYQQALETACRALVAAQPSMAPIVNLANSALRNATAPSSLRRLCHGFGRDIEESVRRISGHAVPLIRPGATVLTYSASQTVREALTRAWTSGVAFRVLCTESRPVCEGTAQARELAAAGIPVTVAADAGLFDLVCRANILLIGADAVATHGVINKTGTSLLALAARHWGKSLYVLCGSEKLVPAGYRLPEEPLRPAGEIVRDPPANLTVENRYFDLTPLDWVAGFLTEEGRLSPWRIRERIERNELHPALVTGQHR